MKRALAGISLVTLLSITVFGQSAGTTPTFELADVHLRAHTSNPTPFMTGTFSPAWTGNDYRDSYRWSTAPPAVVRPAIDTLLK